jgi:hypothetical protein
VSEVGGPRPAPDNRPPEVKLRMEKVACPDCGVQRGWSCSNRLAWPCLGRWRAATRAGLLPIVGRSAPEVKQSFASRLRQVVRGHVVVKFRLPGDTPELVRALHALNAAGLLEPNIYAADAHTLPCPGCGRQTAVWRGQLPSVCTGCRAEYHRDRVREMRAK